MEFYNLLGITKNATQSDIKTAFRLKAKQYHPDVCNNLNDNNLFEEIKKAYDVLVNPETRKLYDESGYVNDSKVDIENQAFEFIRDHLSTVISSHNDDIFKINIIQVIIDYCLDKIRIINNDILKYEFEKNKLNNIHNKFIQKKFLTRNIIQMVISEKISEYNNMINSNRNLLKVLDYSINIISSYSYNFEL